MMNDLKNEEVRISPELLEQYQKLKEYLKSLGSVLVAFSSGVDSTLLLYAAVDALGEKAAAVTATAASFPGWERKEAEDYCRGVGIRHFELETDQFSIPGFAQNPPDRCYLCKKELFSGFLKLAEKEGYAALVEGSNMDDLGDYRPGLQAIAELGIKSPLREAGLYKDQIRALSKYFELPTWEKPSYACLASRFPYGETISREKLTMVEKAEQLLMELGFRQMRVRIHGDDLARIELMPGDFERMMKEETRSLVYRRFKELGFAYVALDLQGYRTGSLNETLDRGLCFAHLN